MANIHSSSRISSIAPAFFCIVSITACSGSGTVNHSVPIGDDDLRPAVTTTRQPLIESVAVRASAANDSLALLATNPAITVATAPTPMPTPTPPLTTSVSAIWYVSTTGSDSNDGRSVDTSFRQIGRAVSMAGPGDVILIRSGVYDEYIKIANSGTSSSPITLSGYPGESVIVDGSSIAPDPTVWIGDYNKPPVIDVAGSYVVVKDLEIRNGAGFGILVTGNNVLLDRLHVHHNYLSNIHFWATHDCTVQNSTVHDANDYNNTSYSGGNADGISDNGFSERLTIRNNESYHNSDDGIDTWDTSHNLIEGNNSHDNGWDYGDGEGIKTGPGGSNVYRNNISHSNKTWGFDAGLTGGNEYYHNTAYENGGAPFKAWSGSNIQVGNSWN